MTIIFCVNKKINNYAKTFVFINIFLLLCYCVLNSCSPHTVTLVVDQLNSLSDLGGRRLAIHERQPSQPRVRAVSIRVLAARRQVLDRVLDGCLPGVLLHLWRFQSRCQKHLVVARTALQPGHAVQQACRKPFGVGLHQRVTQVADAGHLWGQSMYRKHIKCRAWRKNVFFSIGGLFLEAINSGITKSMTCNKSFGGLRTFFWKK